MVVELQPVNEEEWSKRVLEVVALLKPYVNPLPEPIAHCERLAKDYQAKRRPEERTE